MGEGLEGRVCVGEAWEGGCVQGSFLKHPAKQNFGEGLYRKEGVCSQRDKILFLLPDTLSLSL